MVTKITVNAVIDAPIEKVWDFYNNPHHITKWNFADPSWHCPSANNDLRVGGTYNARMEAKDGSFGFDFKVIYDKVTDQNELAYTMEDGRQATTIFENVGNKINVITTFDAESENAIEIQKGGWQAILNNFKNYVESN
jgi:uncharacterized protein YndB with AHSA1/START domain